MSCPMEGIFCKIHNSITLPAGIGCTEDTIVSDAKDLMEFRWKKMFTFDENGYLRSLSSRMFTIDL